MYEETSHCLSSLTQDFTLVMIDDCYYLVAGTLDNCVLLENVHITVANNKELSDWIERNIPF